MIKQVCFNTLKNDIYYGSTIINYTSLTVNHRKQPGEAAFRPLSTGLTGEYEEKISAYYHVCIKHEVFITFTSQSTYQWENQKSAVGKEKLARFSDKGLLLL